MRLVNTLLFASLISTYSFAESNHPKHYDKYTSKVSLCTQIEKNKAPLQTTDLKGISRNSLLEVIPYLKEKRIVDCSYREELDSLTRTLREDKNKINYQSLEDQYLSISLLKKEVSFLSIKKEQRDVIIEASKDKSLEMNILDFFESIE